MGYYSRRLSQKGEADQAIGRCRGSRTTKIHALCDGEGHLYALLLTGGRALLARVPAMRQFIADRAYDVDDVRNFLAARGTGAATAHTAAAPEQIAAVVERTLH